MEVWRKIEGIEALYVAYTPDFGGFYGAWV